MKKVLSAVLAATLVLVMIFSLTSCTKKPSGKYGYEERLSALTLEFEGNTVTVTAKFIVSVSATGTFEMGENGEILITYEDEEDTESMPSGLVYNAEEDTIECSFARDTIKLEKVEE